jgi:transposase
VEELELPGAARKSVELSLRMIDHINEELKPIEEEIRSFARRQAGCKALMGHYGIGELTSVVILAELGTPGVFPAPGMRCATPAWT